MSSTPCPKEQELLSLADAHEHAPALRAHVAECSSCRSALDALRQTGSTLRGLWRRIEKPDASTSEQVDARVGGHLIAGLVRTSARATAYRAINTVSGEDVEVLIARQFIPDALDRKRLRDRARPFLDLDHPCIPRLLDLDFSDQRPFAVISHSPTRSWIADTEREPETRARLAEAVLALHAAGIFGIPLDPEAIRVDDEGQPQLRAWAETLLEFPKRPVPAAEDWANFERTLGPRTTEDKENSPSLPWRWLSILLGGCGLALLWWILR